MGLFTSDELGHECEWRRMNESQGKRADATGMKFLSWEPYGSSPSLLNTHRSRTPIQPQPPSTIHKTHAKV